MAPPTSYSEPQFGAYLASELGDDLAGALGWDASDPRVLEAVNSALLAYGASDIATITGGTNIRRLRALGMRALWGAVVRATAGYYSFSSDGQRFDRHQVNKQAKEALEQAEVECRAYGDDPAYAVSILRVSRPQDPYAVLPDESRVL